MESTDANTTGAKPGAPQKYELGPTISVETDGFAGAWCDNHFRGDPEILNEARRNIEIGYEYRLYGAWVKCGDDTPLGIAAALCSYRPGRALIQQAPKEVWDALRAGGCIPEGGEPNVP
ncbi:MAG TPA: hypothetical protein VF867_07440 [Arthrobacter sp.]